MSTAAVTSIAGHEQRLHPLPLRIMHWINAVAIFIMIGSGWKIYNDDVILGWLHFPDAIVIGIWAQYGLQWHFFGMWIFVLNGTAYLTYGIVTGRFRQKLFPITLAELLATINDALHFRLGHDDLTIYNAVQKILYLGVILVGILIVITGLCLWKPVQFSELASLFYNFQTIRVIHFLCMAAIVGFIVVHVSLALLVPQTLVAMVTGGPVVNGDAALALEPTPAPMPASAPAPLPEPMPEPTPVAEPTPEAAPAAAAEPPAAELPPLGPTNEPTQ
jgi:thiosulfate reductase cytochrome b subunit